MPGRKRKLARLYKKSELIKELTRIGIPARFSYPLLSLVGMILKEQLLLGNTIYIERIGYIGIKSIGHNKVKTTHALRYRPCVPLRDEVRQIAKEVRRAKGEDNTPIPPHWDHRFKGGRKLD